MNDLGTREHYEEYCRNCEDAGLQPISWSEWCYTYPQESAKPSASEPARLEDLAPSHIEIMVQLAKGYRKMVGIRAWEYLFDRDLVDVDENGADVLTERGAALVREYQTRQAASTESIDDLNDFENSGLERDTYDHVVGVSYPAVRNSGWRENKDLDEELGWNAYAASKQAAGDVSGFMHPCEECIGTGTRFNELGYLVPCTYCDGTGINTPQARNDFNAKLTAGASSIEPVWTPERIAALQAENKRLRDALGFYASDNAWIQRWNDDREDFQSDVDRDGGDIAREALQPASKEAQS